MRLASLAFVMVLMFVACRGMTPVVHPSGDCDQVYEEVVMLHDHFTYTALQSIPKLDEDITVARSQLLEGFNKLGFQLRNHPSWLPKGPLWRYTQTLPIREVWLHPKFHTWSDVNQLAHLLHELAHAVIEDRFKILHFSVQYVGNTMFRLAFELSAYGIQMRELRKRKKWSYRREASWREHVIKGLDEGYFIKLSIDIACTARLSEAVWGGIPAGDPLVH